MSNFQGIERRVLRECEQIGLTKAERMVRDIAIQLGFRPESSFYMTDELRDALKPLRVFAAGRFADIEMARVWGEAEAAALAVMKREVKP